VVSVAQTHLGKTFVVTGVMTPLFQTSAGCGAPAVRRREIKQLLHQADESLPGRWLATADAAFAADRDRDEPLLPSRVGPHNCVGSQLAYGEMPLIFATLIWSWIRERCRAEIGWGAGGLDSVG
jgi:cytochrome P450